MPGSFDRAKFVKVCGMLTSSHDGEVVAAARRANAMLKEANLTWEQALAQPTTNGAYQGAAGFRPQYEGYTQPPTRHRPRTPQNKWNAFASTYPDVARWLTANNDTNEFAASLVRGVLKYGSLTERQMAAVRRHL